MFHLKELTGTVRLLTEGDDAGVADSLFKRREIIEASARRDSTEGNGVLAYPSEGFRGDGEVRRLEALERGEGCCKVLVDTNVADSLIADAHRHTGYIHICGVRET